MSDTSTLIKPGTESFVDLLGMVDDLSVKCADVLARSAGEYEDLSSFVALTLEELVVEDDGSLEAYRSAPIIVAGWSLKTAPFFLSDPRMGFTPAVFTAGCGYEPQPISREYLELRSRKPRQFPRMSALNNVHQELLAILSRPS